MAASKTVQQLIAACPQSFENTADVNNWLSQCFRWSDIENYPEVKETSWLGICKIDDLNSRRQYRETVLAQLNAIKDITVVSTPPTT